ncbi:hypothetical protein HMPREF9946_03087 [Acetobacteraceae bacterium AT-5844]|nr:hypothetical protein HMPREF9946_03087 [Acetobacteraceae bacterium AT-5844]
MSHIPEARLIIARLLPDVEAALPDAAADLRHALELMHRRPYAKPRAPDRSAPVCATKAKLIRAYVARHPRASIQEVAVIFHTNSGRVSEAIQGDR